MIAARLRLPSGLLGRRTFSTEGGPEPATERDSRIGLTMQGYGEPADDKHEEKGEKADGHDHHD